MNILVLHHLGDPRHWRVSMAEHELCLPKYAPDHQYLVHDCAVPLPPFVRDMDFDGIVLTQTFLGRRRHRRVLERVLEEYAFVKHSHAFTIAAPQDDYECSHVLDNWLADWNVDRIYTVCPQHWDILYPRNHSTGKIRLGYTGYLGESQIRRWPSAKPMAERRIDVSYRTATMPDHIGEIGHIKTVIGERFRAAAEGRGLVLDISSDLRDAIVGSKWHDFLEDSKFVLGANSGSSMYDPTGELSEKAIGYRVRNPSATFEEVKAACFPGQDGRYEFTAISPRNLECALIESVQVLTPGLYSGVLGAGVHYLPMAPDLSNATDLFARMSDRTAARRIAQACKEAVLSQPTLRYEHHVAELVEGIGAAARPGRGAPAGQRALVERYRREMSRIEPAHWRRERARQSMQSALVSIGARRVKRVLAGMLGGGPAR